MGGGRRGRTGEDESALFSEEAAVIVPFRGVAVNRPAFTKFGDAIAIKDLFGAAIDVAVDVGLGLFLGDVVDHLDCCEEDELVFNETSSHK